MELTWLGHSCFRLRGKEVTLVADPPSPSTGYSLGRLSADIVTISHDHPGHNYVRAVSGDPYIIRGPGEYEIRNALISGFQTYHDEERGARLGRNTVYLYHIDDLLICHLGDLGHLLNSREQEEVNGCDVLLLPVGGGNALDAKKAVEVVSQIEPQVIIPMHYATPALKPSAGPLDPLDKFCKEMGVEAAEPLPKLNLTRGSLPPEPQVVLLTYRGAQTGSEGAGPATRGSWPLSLWWTCRDKCDSAGGEAAREWSDDAIARRWVASESMR